MSDPSVHVIDNRDASRYEIRVGEELAGYATYQDQPGRRIILHTETESGFAGQGLASRLASEALDDIRRRHLTVTPRCPFIADYIREHPDYADLVTAPPGRAR